MSPEFEILFKKHTKNEEMIAYSKANPLLFPQLIEATLSPLYNKSWRCAMLLGHLIKKEDPRLQPYIEPLIAILPQAIHDGHQRQLLVILDKLIIDEVQQGRLFNYCLTIWEDINKISSTRMRAFWMMEKIAKNYPILKRELQYFVTPYYTETLSVGIKHSIQKKYGKL